MEDKPQAQGQAIPALPFGPFQVDREFEAGDIFNVVRFLWEGKWIILASTALVFFSTFFYYRIQPDVYTATSQVLVEKVGEETEKYMQNIPKPTAAMDDGSYDFYGTKIAILRSSKITEKVMKKVGDAGGYDLAAKRLEQTGVLQIAVTHRDSEMAAKLANAYADIFVEESQSEQQFINEQILKYFPETDDLINQPNLGKLPLNKKQFADSVLTVATDPDLLRMKEQKVQYENQLNDLLQRYLPEHPSVREAESRLRALEEKIRERTTNLLKIARASLSGEIKISNVRVLEYASPPDAPSAPNRPKGIFLFTFAGLGASCAGVYFAKRLHPKIISQKDIQPLSLTFLGYIPFVAGLTKKKGGADAILTGAVALQEILEGEPVLADAVVNVRTHMLFSVPYEKSKRIMVTSAVPNEGKSTFAVLLALSFTALGRKILLIDGDLRKPTIQKYLNLKEAPGLSDYLLGVASRDEVIQSLSSSTLKVVTAGITQTPYVPELLSSPAFSELIAYGTEHFDRVIIDVPPSLRIPDSLIVAKHFQAGVLVCGSNMVYRKSIQIVKEKFEAVHQIIVGVVINRADYETEDYYHKKYGYYHYHYYASRPGMSAKERLGRWKFADK